MLYDYSTNKALQLIYKNPTYSLSKVLFGSCSTCDYTMSTAPGQLELPTSLDTDPRLCLLPLPPPPLYRCAVSLAWPYTGGSLCCCATGGRASVSLMGCGGSTLAGAAWMPSEPGPGLTLEEKE